MGPANVPGYQLTCPGSDVGLPIEQISRRRPAGLSIPRAWVEHSELSNGPSGWTKQSCGTSGSAPGSVTCSPHFGFSATPFTSVASHTRSIGAGLSSAVAARVGAPAKSRVAIMTRMIRLLRLAEGGVSLLPSPGGCQEARAPVAYCGGHDAGDREPDRPVRARV